MVEVPLDFEMFSEKMETSCVFKPATSGEQIRDLTSDHVRRNKCQLAHKIELATRWSGLNNLGLYQLSNRGGTAISY